MLPGWGRVCLIQCSVLRVLCFGFSVSGSGLQVPRVRANQSQPCLASNRAASRTAGAAAERVCASRSTFTFSPSLALFLFLPHPPSSLTHVLSLSLSLARSLSLALSPSFPLSRPLSLARSLSPPPPSPILPASLPPSLPPSVGRRAGRRPLLRKETRLGALQRLAASSDMSFPHPKEQASQRARARARERGRSWARCSASPDPRTCDHPYQPSPTHVITPTNRPLPM